MTSVTAAIELLVGAACVAIAWASWRRGAAVFRATAVVLAIAGIVAAVNAVVTLVR